LLAVLKENCLTSLLFVSPKALLTEESIIKWLKTPLILAQRELWPSKARAFFNIPTQMRD